MSKKLFIASLCLLLLAVFAVTGFMFSRNLAYRDGNLLCEKFFQELCTMEENRDFGKFPHYVAQSFLQAFEKELVEADTRLHSRLQHHVDTFYCAADDRQRFTLFILLTEQLGDPAASDFYVTGNGMEVITGYLFPGCDSMVTMKLGFSGKGNSLQLKTLEGFTEVLQGYYMARKHIPAPLEASQKIY